MFDELVCSHCKFSSPLEGFVNWERGGQRGLLGKTPDGHIMVRCPSCKGELKFDSLQGRFVSTPADAASSTGGSARKHDSVDRVVVFLIALFSLVVVVMMYFQLDHWIRYIVGPICLAFAWYGFRFAFVGKRKEKLSEEIENSADRSSETPRLSIPFSPGNFPIFDLETNLPEKLGRLELIGVKYFPDSSYGVEIRYEASGYIKADIYLYPKDITLGSEGLESASINTEFQGAVDGIVKAAAMGIYRDLKFGLEESICLPELSEQPLYRCLQFSYAQSAAADVDFHGRRVSYLAMRYDRGFINKVRFSFPSSENLFEEHQKDLMSFLGNWYEAVKQRY